MESKDEIWGPISEFSFVEASSYGRVRTLDRFVKQGDKKRFVRGQILKRRYSNSGYLYVKFRTNGKSVGRFVHRLVAEAFLSNPDSLPEINHKDNNPLNNTVSNLEWCTHKYNIEYREKFGTPAKDYIHKSPVIAVRLKTWVVLRFKSQSEAARSLGIDVGHINNVVKGRQKTAGGYWFVDANSHAVESTRAKFGDEVADRIERLMGDK